MCSETTYTVQPWSSFVGQPDATYGFNDFYFVRQGTGIRAIDDVSEQGLSLDGLNMVTDLDVLIRGGQRLDPTDSVYKHPSGGLIVRRPLFWDKAAGFERSNVYPAKLLDHALLLALAHFSKLTFEDHLWGETDPGKPDNQTVLPYNFTYGGGSGGLQDLGALVDRMIEVWGDLSQAQDELEAQLISKVELKTLKEFRAEIDRLEIKAAGGVLERTMVRMEKNPVITALLAVVTASVIGGAFRQGFRGTLLFLLSYNPEEAILLPWAEKTAIMMRTSLVRMAKALPGATTTAIRGELAAITSSGGRYLLHGAARAVGSVALIDFALGGVVTGYGALLSGDEESAFKLGRLAEQQILMDETHWLATLFFGNVMSSALGGYTLLSKEFERDYLDAIDAKVEGYVTACDEFGDLVSANLSLIIADNMTDEQIDWNGVEADLQDLYAKNTQEVKATYEFLELTGHRAHRGQEIKNLVAEDGSIRDTAALKAHLREKIEAAMKDKLNQLRQALTTMGLAKKDSGRFVATELNSLSPAQTRFIQGMGRELLEDIFGMELTWQMLSEGESNLPNPLESYMSGMGTAYQVSSERIVTVSVAPKKSSAPRTQSARHSAGIRLVGGATRTTVTLVASDPVDDQAPAGQKRPNKRRPGNHRVANPAHMAPAMVRPASAPALMLSH